jgi:hypothetical protein
MPDLPRPRLSGRAAVAIVRSDPPQVFLAEDDEVLGRVLAIKLVAQTAPAHLGAWLTEIREALLEERWADAVLAWMSATGEVVDAYPDDRIWTEEQLDAGGAALEIRLSPAFLDSPTTGPRPRPRPPSE